MVADLFRFVGPLDCGLYVSFQRFRNQNKADVASVDLIPTVIDCGDNLTDPVERLRLQYAA